MSSRDFNDIIDFPQKIALQSLNIDVSKPLIAIVCAQSGLSFVHKNAQNTAEGTQKTAASAPALATPFATQTVDSHCLRAKRVVLRTQKRAEHCGRDAENGCFGSRLGHAFCNPNR